MNEIIYFTGLLVFSLNISIVYYKDSTNMSNIVDEWVRDGVMIPALLIWPITVSLIILIYMHTKD